MADISLEAVTGKLNRLGYEAFIQALRQAKGAGNRHVELAHWLAHILQRDAADICLTADHFQLDRARLAADVARVCGEFRCNETEMPDISNTVIDVLDRGWHYATLMFGEIQIRTGHVLAGALKSRDLRRSLIGISAEFAKIPPDVLTSEHRSIWRGSEEENLRAANAVVVNDHHRQPLARAQGGGTLSSSDGLRLPMRGKSLTARALSRYFTDQGVTTYCHVSDQHSTFGTRVIVSTERDGLYVLDEILGNTTELPIVEHTTDTHGQMLATFALFDFVGKKLSPRIAKITDKPRWRPHPRC